MRADFSGREVVLWGAKGHALVLERAIAELGGRVVALVDNDPDVVTSVPDLPLLVGAEGLRNFLDDMVMVHRPAGLVAIGGSRGADRRHIATHFAKLGIEVPILVHPRAFVCSGAVLGSGTQVLALASVAAGADIGAACILNHGARVDHECRIGAGTHVAPGATLCGLVETDEDVFIGAGAIVLPRVQIGRGAIIGAGAVVIHNVESGTTVVGRPARRLAPG